MASIDVGELVDFVADEVGLDVETIMTMIEIEHEYMFGYGLVTGPEPEWRFFSPLEFGGSGTEVDPAFLAVIAEQRAGIPVDSALQVFESELNFLIQKGIAQSFPPAESQIPQRSDRVDDGCTE